MLNFGQSPTFNHYSDPGHSWVRVPKSLIEYLNLENKISSYSYVKNKWVYLEEDCDYSIFRNTFLQHYNKEPITVMKHTNNRSSIRNYCHYTA